LLHFVTQLDELLRRTDNEAMILERGHILLTQLLSQDDWLPDEFAQPDPNRYQQFLLYADPKDRFSVVTFVWGPGQSTPIHDHTVWGLLGMLRGAELTQPFAQDAQGRWLPSGAQQRIAAGHVDTVSPRIGDVHRVWNALSDQPSISIHVYGGNIGKIRRHVFQEDGTIKEFISGYSNALSEEPTEFPLTTFLQVREALLQRQEIAIVDVRDVDEWIADSSSPYGKEFCPRKGRIPGARWLEWYRMMKPTGEGQRFKAKDEVLAECATVGVTPETPVYLYCFKGARASNTFLALKNAGVKDVRMYFGSWNEWSRDPALPIESGSPFTKAA
jgi:predicted metal-dependent enzyme (double-stranded beta helix superfamily)/rhodanese-related sulfurtransferase